MALLLTVALLVLLAIKVNNDINAAKKLLADDEVPMFI